MTTEDYNLEYVAIGIAHGIAALNFRHGQKSVGEELVFARDDDGDGRSWNWMGDGIDRQGANGHGVGKDCGVLCKVDCGGIVDVYLSGGEYFVAGDPSLEDLEVDEVGDEDEVGALTWLEEAYGEVIMLDGSDTGGVEDIPEMVEGFGMTRNGALDEEVDVALEEFVGIDVVGAEHEHSDVGGIVDKRDELFEIAGGAAFSDEDFLTKGDAFAGMLDVVDLMVGGYAYLDVTASLFASESWSVAIDNFAGAKGCLDFFARDGIAGEDAGIVHHLGKPIERRHREIAFDIGEIDIGARRLDGGAGAGHT